MAKVSRSQDNIFPVPMNCTVNKKTGYVLANLTNEYASSNSKGKCSYSTHKKNWDRLRGRSYQLERQPVHVCK